MRAEDGRFGCQTFYKIIAWLVAVVLIYLNFKMLISQALGLYSKEIILLKIYHYCQRAPFFYNIADFSDIPQYNKIAVALDFLKMIKLISYTISQGNANTQYVLCMW